MFLKSSTIMLATVKRSIKDSPKEDKPASKGQDHILYRGKKSPLKECNLSTEDKMAGLTVYGCNRITSERGQPNSLRTEQLVSNASLL